MFSTEVGDDVYEEDKSVKNNSPNTNSWYILIYTLEDKKYSFYTFIDYKYKRKNFVCIK